MTTQRWLLYSLGVAVGSLLLVLALDAVDRRIWRAQERAPLYSLNATVTDLAFQLRRSHGDHDRLTPRDVVVIDVDNASIAELGRVQTWPRSYTARVVSYVSGADPRAIALDLLYTEPDTLASAYADMLRDAGYAAPEPILRALRSDARLADAIRQSGRTYLALFDDTSPVATADTARLRRDSVSLDHVHAPPDRVQSYAVLKNPVLPVPILRTAARGVAPVTLFSEGDGAIRRYSTLQHVPALPSDTTGAKALVPSFGFRLALEALGVPLDSVGVADGRVDLGTTRSIPVRGDGTFRINWLGSDEQIRRISYHKVLNQRIPAAFFEDKFVFVGASATGLDDLHPTPVGDKKPGVEIHAEAFLSMVNGSFLDVYRVRDLIGWMLAAGFGLALLFLGVKPLLASLFTALIILVQFFGYVLYVARTLDVVLPIGTLILGTGIVFVGSTVLRYVTEERERQRLQAAFSAYVSPAVASMIADRAGSLKLGGEQKELTVLFADIRNFTRISEQLSPPKLVSFLNDYFRVLSEAVLEKDGTIDKYIGDAVMAFFGAPLSQDDHALRACRAALAMAERVRDVPNPTRPDEPVQIAIGISTGPMVAGNIGSDRRFDYTVIGDAVNVGDRVEGLNRTFRTTLLVSESTYRACLRALDDAGDGGAEMHFRCVGTTRVKGRDEPVRVYELMPPHFYDDPQALKEAFDHARQLYHAQEFQGAVDAFQTCLELQPGDGPSEYYLARCKECQSDPARYREVIQMTTK